MRLPHVVGIASRIAAVKQGEQVGDDYLYQMAQLASEDWNGNVGVESAFLYPTYKHVDATTHIPSANTNATQALAWIYERLCNVNSWCCDGASANTYCC